MNIYCVRQKSTGYFIPKLLPGYRKGGSHLEPEKDCKPRIFYSKVAAAAFINVWIKGIIKTDGYLNSFGEYEPTLKVEKQEHRKKEDMEIVEFMVTEMH